MGSTVHNEHFVPEPGRTIQSYLAAGEKTAVHHLIRYRWAEHVLDAHNATGRLLDVACGAGYGTASLAGSFSHLNVVGGDYDPEAIEFARHHYHAANLWYVHADITRWTETLGHDKFDWIVSFDTIEHIEHREIAMQNVVDHLHPHGTMLLSTPVRSENRLNPGWEHHKIEYSRRSLYDFLSRYFRTVLAPDLGTLPCADVFDEVNAGTSPPFYSLKMNPVVCRDPITLRWPG